MRYYVVIPGWLYTICARPRGWPGAGRLGPALQNLGQELDEREHRATLPTDALTEAAEEIGADIERKVAGSEQASRVARALERRYDSTVAADGRPSLLAKNESLPTADELGAEAERYLAEFENGAAE